MKTKPVSHKSDNTFKFESFGERLSKINVSLLHNITRKGNLLSAEEAVTHFAVTLEKWFDLNATQDFRQLCQSIGSLVSVQSLPQIVHRKDQLIDILVNNLNRKDNLAIDVVLELVVALAKDLNTDFYQDFDRVFSSVTNCLHSTDPEVIENVFICLTFLFKYLSKYITKEFESKYKLFESLLTSKREYIRRFSAEALSFLIRKAQIKSSVINTLSESVAKEPKLVDGIAFLLFESVKGVNNGFHSSAENLINLLLEKYFDFENESFDSTIVLLFKLLTEYISEHNFGLIWKILVKDSIECRQNLRKVIPLLKEVIGYKKCQLVENVSELVPCLVKYLKSDCLRKSDKNDVLICFNYLLFNCYQRLSPEDYRLINEAIFESNNLSINQIFNFTKSVFNCFTFERTILPSILTFCCQQFSQSTESIASLKLLTELVVTKRPRPINGSDIRTISKYVLSVDQILCQKLVDVLSNSNDLKTIWSALVCLPNLIPITDETKVIALLKETLHKIKSKIISNNCCDQWLGFVIVEAVIALILMKNKRPIDELNDEFFIDLIVANPSNTELLRALDLYLSYNKELLRNTLDLKILETLYPKSLEMNLSSFCKTRRLITLHILTLFDPPLPPSEDIDSPKTSIFRICFDAESVPSELSQYRLKLKHLQSLDNSYVKNSTPLPTSGGLNFDQMPIHYLFGALYENLTLLWNPIIKLIQTYAKGLEDKKSFMNILLNHFRENTERINSKTPLDLNYYQKGIKEFLESEFYISNATQQPITERPDFSNHRILLLKAMDSFAEVVEPSNREFISVLFDFIDNEMSYHMLIGNNSKENIQKEEQLNEMDIDMAGEPKSDIGRRTSWKTLFAFLTVLSKFKNPKVLYRERELLELYLNLLTPPDSESQKHAFNCIANYEKYLTDFRNNFLNLIDEKTFKSEVFSFLLNSEDETNILKSEYRPNVVAIVLRILYGKLMASNGTKTHGKNKSDFRRSLILKALMAFNPNELIIFMDFVFAPISHFVSTDYTTLKEKIDSEVNIKSMTPLRQFQALIKTLNFILKNLGNTSPLITSYVFKVLVVISTLVSTLLTEKRNEINEQSITRLKDIRNTCFKVCQSFFDTFDAYNYSDKEIDGLFNGLIWPLLPHLNTESLNTPTPLLLLLTCFTKNSRYFKLLAKSHPSNTDLTPIAKIIELFSHPKVQTPVISSVTELIVNLLTLDDFDSVEQNLNDIEVNEMNAIFTNKSSESFGTKLCLPFVSQILNRIGLNFENSKKTKKKKNSQSFSSHELKILSHLTAYVTQTDQSLDLVLLLIHSIENKKMEEQKEYQTLKALSHLVKNVRSEVIRVLKLLTPLFGTVLNCNSRTQLCHTLIVLCEENHNLSVLSQLVSNINAYNPRFPEEPDYPKRIDAFKSINSKLESISRDEFNSEFITLIMYNCVHFIQFCNDLAIRESAAYALKNLLMKFEHFDDSNLFEMFAINILLYSTISKGFRNKSETVRHELIEVLFNLIEISGRRHPILQQLSLLCNKEDEEIDFWLNIKHIQLHRRSRALTRLTKSEDLLQKLSPRIFSQFLIPLTSNFLTDSHYAKHTSLVNASIEAIGVFSKHIQWSKYYHILKFYINQLINKKGEQKLNIKIVCSLLDNFPFCESSVIQSSQEDEDVVMDDEEEDEETKDESEEVKTGSDNDLSDEPIVISKPNRIADSISNNLLPLLRKVLHQKSQIDFAYDSTKSEFSEDEDIQRIPIGLAIIKLLKSVGLSEEVLKTNASSVFLRLCQFLQSRAQSIRDLARNTFVKVMQCLGPKYILNAVNQMKSILRKGYQRHVFVYTVHSILAELKPQLKPGDIDNCLEVLLEICSLELFGNLSEEKEVSQITSKLKEAKKSKSYEIFEIISAFVTQNSLPRVLVPLKTTLLEANTHKVVRKVSQSLSKVGQGLVLNTALDEETLLSFIYNTINDIVCELNAKYNDIPKEVTKKFKRNDSFLISRPIYQRSERVTKIGGTANSHIVIEFGLNCFLALLKQNRLQSSNGRHLSLLDPFVKALNDLLESKDPKLTTLSLQCLFILYTKFGELSSFGIHSENIMKTIFVLLHKYAKFGYNDREDTNVQMVLLCFKTLSLFIKDRSDVTINDEQMAVLLSYVDQDLHNDSCQSTVFVILKSILSRNFSSLALHRIIKRVTQMAITSEVDSVRNNCGQICVKYLADYSHPKGLKKKIDFFIRHIEYEKIAGRESALTVLKQLIAQLDYKFLIKNITIFFVPLSSRLVNESSSECKKEIAETITKLLKRINESDRNKLFNEMVVPWLQSEQVLQKLLASHLCTLFLSVDNKDFMKQLPNVLPFIKQQLDPTRYQDFETEDISTSKTIDAFIYQHLSLFLKLMKTDSQIIKKYNLVEEVNTILEYILSYHVLHPHLWIRVICVQIFGQLFSEYTIQCLANSMDNPSEENEFLLSNTKEKLSQMITKFCLLFRDIYDTEVLSDQLIKNLVYISRVFIQSSIERTNGSMFKWLLNKLIFEVKYEIKETQNQKQKRICVFKWMAVVAVELGSDRLDQYIGNFLPLLCREETNSEKANEDNEVLVLTKQVLQLLKNIIGTEKFTEFYSKAKSDLSLKRIERKKKNAVQSVNEVVKSTKRKISKHNRNKVSKKRKISHFRQF